MFDSFLALRENYFKLNNLQRDLLIRNNPELLLDTLTLEESLIKLGVVFPSEADFYVNRANYAVFGIEATDFHKKFDVEEVFGPVSASRVENAQIKNALLFKGFASRLGIDVETAERCIRLAEQSREIDLECGPRGGEETGIESMIYKMEKSGQVQKMISLGGYVRFLESGLGDSIDPSENYIHENFSTLFNYERSMRFLNDENNIMQNFLGSMEEHSVIDGENANIAR